MFKRKMLVTVVVWGGLLSGLIGGCYYFFNRDIEIAQSIEPQSIKPQSTKPQSTNPQSDKATVGSPPIASALVVKGQDSDDQSALQAQCRQKWLEVADIAGWQNKKRQQYSDFFHHQQRKGISDTMLDRVAIAADMGLFNGRMLRSNYIYQRMMPKYHDQLDNTIDQEHQLKMLKILFFGDVNKLLSALGSQPYNDFRYLHKDGRPLMLLSYILTFEPFVDADIITELVDHGVAVTYTDLAFVTEQQLPLALVRKLYDLSGLDAQHVLVDQGKYTSLALLAMEGKNAELAHFWINMGSPLAPDPFYHNALDVLAMNGEYPQQALTDQLFIAITQQLTQPFWPRHSATLAAIISETVYARYLATLVQPLTKPLANPTFVQVVAQSLPVTQQQQVIIDDLVEKLLAISLTEMPEFDISRPSEQPCFVSVGKRLTRFALKNYNQRLFTPKTTKAALVAGLPQRLSQLVEDRIKTVNGTINGTINGTNSYDQLQQQFGSEQEIEQHLAADQSLAGKTALESYRREKLTRQASEIKAEMFTTEGYQQITVLVSEIFQLARQGDWQGAMAKYEQLAAVQGIDTQSKESLKVLLGIAIDTDASIELINTLLAKGAEPSSMVIMSLLRKDNRPLAELLLPYGLKLDEKPLQRSLLAHSIQFSAVKMFAFLLAQGVSVDSDNMGLDPLDIAIANFDPFGTQFLFIDGLIKAGAKIELSHQQAVDRLKVDNMPAYAKLTSRYPQLGL